VAWLNRSGSGASTSRRSGSRSAARARTQIVELFDFPTDLKTGARLATIYESDAPLAQELAAERPPLFVWVEQPASYGRVVEPALMYAVGVVQARSMPRCSSALEHPTEVRTIAVAEWKKAAVGFGNAKKHQVLEWAKRDGLVTEHACSELVRSCKDSGARCRRCLGDRRRGRPEPRRPGRGVTWRRNPRGGLEPCP
jgi:Holliday junction resolvasome RuvABC endonuclease subunit